MADAPVEIKREPADVPSGDEDVESNGASPKGLDAGDGKLPSTPTKKANGDSEVKVKEERTEDYEKLIAYGLDMKVASRLDDIYKTGESSCLHSFLTQSQHLNDAFESFLSPQANSLTRTWTSGRWTPSRSSPPTAPSPSSPSSWSPTWSTSQTSLHTSAGS